jgi:protein-L-isoaspartate(D-aspartate) O-methyltransferase
MSLKKICDSNLEQRENMVWGQLRPNGIYDEKLIESFLKTPKEPFIPTMFWKIAYNDLSIPLLEDHSRYLTPNMVLSRLIQNLKIKEKDKILIVGSATGYSASIIYSFSKNIFAIESNENLYHKSIINLENFKEIQISFRPLVEGWLDQAPFDSILIDGAIEEIPSSILRQLQKGGKIAFSRISNRKNASNGFYLSKSMVMQENNVLDVFDSNVIELDEFKKDVIFEF